MSGKPKTLLEQQFTCVKCLMPKGPLVFLCKCGGGGGGGKSDGGSSGGTEEKGIKNTKSISVMFKPHASPADKTPISLSLKTKPGETPTLKLSITDKKDESEEITEEEQKALEKTLKDIKILLEEFKAELKKDPQNNHLAIEEYKAEIKDGVIVITMNAKHQQQFLELLRDKGLLPNEQNNKSLNPFKITFTPDRN